MASTMLQNPNINPATFPGDSFRRECSLSHVITMKREKNTTSLRRSAAVASVISPAKATTKIAQTSSSSSSSSSSKLARVWREVQGANDWEDLVDPLDPLLREEIVRYGEFVTACYKAFDLEPTSKRYLNCKYGKKNVLREVGLGDSGYQVTKYIYATPDTAININPIQNGASNCGRWIGYVAVSSDEEVQRLGRRDILVTFRGTVTNPEWIANFMSSLTPARFDPHNPRLDVKVEAGFLSLYTSDESDTRFGLESCREQLLSEISRLISKHKGEEISLTLAGHSMGSSLALLLAYDIAELGLNRDGSNREIPVTVFSFAGPRVGNSGFKQRCEELGVKVLRIVNVNDPITKMPGVFFNENFRVSGGRYEFPWSYNSCYAHVGVELALDFFKMQNPSCVHDLETYINLLRCPEELRIQRSSSDGVDFLSRAKEMLLISAYYFNGLPWKNAAFNMVNMVQSQITFS